MVKIPVSALKRVITIFRKFNKTQN
jgi:hypothetical protein